MSNERTIDELIDAFNAQAQAEGRYDSRTFWEAPARPGSVRDIPETEKAKDDLAWFRARRLAKEKAWARSALQALLEKIDAKEKVQVRGALQALREEADRLLGEQEMNV
ncbi:MAG TPA: hypothetical protein VJ783_11080 [Pirellulales bacterium]|nr:hypothetical protein [Pirellulales bacterium]